jgi:hypothetical protein
MNARADRIDRDDVPLLVAPFDIDQTRNQELAPVKALVLSRRNYRPNYACKNHISVTSNQRQATRD